MSYRRDAEKARQLDGKSLAIGEGSGSTLNETRGRTRMPDNDIDLLRIMKRNQTLKKERDEAMRNTRWDKRLFLEAVQSTKNGVDDQSPPEGKDVSKFRRSMLELCE